MMNFDVRSVNTSKAQSKVKAAVEAALGITAENVLADCSVYVPVDTGALHDHGETRVSKDGKSASVVWGTDEQSSKYARPVYYCTDKRHDPPTRDHWFDYAKGLRGDAWRGMFAQAVKERL